LSRKKKETRHPKKKRGGEKKKRKKKTGRHTVAKQKENHCVVVFGKGTEVPSHAKREGTKWIRRVSTPRASEKKKGGGTRKKKKKCGGTNLKNKKERSRG